MGYRLGTPSAAGMGSDSAAELMQIDKKSQIQVDECCTAVHLRQSIFMQYQ